MEIVLQTSGEWAGWWRVSHTTKKVVSYIRYTVPAQYRHYDSGHCYVHTKYIEGVRQLANSSSPVIVEDPWVVLHLRPSAPPAIIKAVWRELAKLLHPDHGGSAEEFRRAKEAYEVLTRR